MLGPVAAGGDAGRGRKKLTTAAALIDKAEASTFAAEQESLALKAYTELASFLNSFGAQPPSGPGGRLRDRRLLVDRRAPGRPESGPRRDGIDLKGDSPPETIDLPADGPTEVIDLRVQQARAVYRRPVPSTLGAVVDFSL